MREFARIHRICEKYARLWSLVGPDQRMGQFLSNLHGLGPQDVFYTEDDRLEEVLDSLYTEALKGSTEEGVGRPDYVGALRRSEE